MRKGIFILTAALAFGLFACDNDSPAGENNDGAHYESSSQHEHQFSEEWTYDSVHHWHEAVCGHSERSDVGEHSFVSKVTEATYEAGGYTTYTCSVCGYSYTDNETDKLEHHYSDDWSHDEHSHWHACTDEGYENLKEDDAHHDFRSEITPATYEADGYTTYTCNTCGYSYVDDKTDKLEHHYSSEWSKDEESHWRACTDPGYEDLKTGEAHHTFQTNVVPATYEAGGYTTYTCDVCEYSYVGDITPKLGHHYSEDWSFNGQTHWHACTDEGYENLKEDEGAHEFQEIVTPPTGLEEGYTTHYCACGYTYVDSPTAKLTYTVTWKNSDGEVLEVDDGLPYGTIPSYDGETPTKSHTSENEYDFIGWDKEIEPVESDQEYIALFEAVSRRTFEITFKSSAGSYAETYLADSKNRDDDYVIEYVPEREGHTFLGWNTLFDDTTYRKGDVFSANRDAEFYALWAENCTQCTNGTVDKSVTCSKCSGSGKTYKKCSSCSGNGGTFKVKCSYNCGWGGTTVYTLSEIGGKCPRCGAPASIAGINLCSSCRGTGQVVAGKCTNCNGLGYTGDKHATCTTCHGDTFIRPDAPVVDSMDYNYVSLEPIDGYEYSLDGETWTTSPVFTGLHSATQYCFYQRLARTSETPFGLTSYACCVTTPAAPVYSIAYTDEQETTNPNPTTYTPEDSIILEDLSKDGYTFTGWTGSNGETPEKNVAIPMEELGNLAFTANWEINTYSITYVLFGGTNALKNPSTYTIEDTIELKDAKKDYYTFEGWYLDANFTKKITTIRHYTEDLTLYAHFVPFVYTATFDPGEGHFDINVTLNWGVSSIANETRQFKSGDTIYPYQFDVPTRSGYVFAGWFLDKKLTTKLPDTMTLSTDITLYALWRSPNSDADKITHDWYYSVFGDEQSEGQYFYVPYEYSGTATITYTCTGYHYRSTGVTASQFYISGNGYYFSGNSGYPNTTTESGSTEVDLAPGYSYYIHMYSGGSSGRVSITIKPTAKPLTDVSCEVSAYNTSEEAYETTTQYPTPVRDDHDFDGWLDSDGNPIHETWDYTSDQTFTPQWKVHEYAIDYELNGGTNNASNPSSYKADDPTISLADPTKDGYTFEGWFSDAAFKHPISEIDCQSRTDYVLYAKWVADYFAIDYELNGGTNNPGNPAMIGRTEDFDLLEPTKAGYTFKGWFSDVSFGTEVTTIHGSDRCDHKVYAKWEANSYTATLDYDGGELCPTVTFVSNGGIIKTVELYGGSTLDFFVPEGDSGRRFKGWFTDPSLATEPFDFSGEITSDLTLYARWGDVESMYIDLGSSYQTEISGSTTQTKAIMSYVDQTVTVSSSSNLDLVGKIYNDNLDLVCENDDISDDDLNFSMTFEMKAGKTYYIVFNASLSQASGEATISVSGTQIPDTAISGVSATLIESVDVVYDASFELPVPKKEGYVFAGWYDADGNPIDVTAWNYAQNITIYAHWTPIA